ncbi:hypothetical protein BH09CHL1_BH09CHL1_28060 [soil metagenome]
MARRSRPARLHGVLIIDKPAGWTSHDVVARVRRLVGEKKVGHSGPLDPMATGVLPVGVGDATRMIEYLAEAGKRYLAEVTFGVQTDTLDAEGNVTKTADPSALSESIVAEALKQFQGPLEQIPPMHAAIKVDGVKLYELARKGIEIERVARPVTIYEITLLEWNAPIATIDISCSKGFYVRSLARDLGDVLGVGAHLSNLVRVSTGPFSLDDAWTLTELGQLDRDDFSEQWSSIAVHPDSMVGDKPAIILNEETRRRWINGMGFVAEGVTDEIVSVYADTGEWMGSGHGDLSRNEWVPTKVAIDRTKRAEHEREGHGVTILHSLDVEQRTPAVLTIGTFDGVHLGHQALLRQTIERAKALGVSSVVVTFEPIPAMVLRPDKFKGRICPSDEKIAHLSAAGIDMVCVLPFDRELSLESPEEFLGHLNDSFDVREIWVGEAFTLGKDRVGNVQRLQEIGTDLGFSVNAMPRVANDDELISSSYVRDAIINGDVERAARMLGRWFHVDGVVIHNSHFGRTMGYPTANVEPPVDQVPLADGIYATYCQVHGEEKRHWGMTYIGTRPTVNSGARQIETNVLDFEGDLYGHRIRVDFVRHLRHDEAFDSLQLLIEQLGRDEIETRRVLSLLEETA